MEFDIQNIPFVFEPIIQLDYKGTILETYFKPDFVCYDKIVVELKAVSKLIDEHRAQTINYLNAAKFDLALLINFGHFPQIERERFGSKEKYWSLKKEMNRGLKK